MRVLITGADGFIGKNLSTRLQAMGGFEVSKFTRKNTISDFFGLLKTSDCVFHLAGANRPQSSDEFHSGNYELTGALVEALEASNRVIPIFFTSSIQVELDNHYGRSKLAAEKLLLDLNKRQGNGVFIYRLPNVFGKWSMPNYNSVVATFCFNVSRNLPVTVHEPSKLLNLLYIDDLIDNFIQQLQNSRNCCEYVSVDPTYNITVSDLLEVIYSFNESRSTLEVGQIGIGLERALYSTFLSYMETSSFGYKVPRFEDPRGVFVEVFKNLSVGQFSFYCQSRCNKGGHYHNSKVEKFLVVKGNANFRFVNVISGEKYEKSVNDQVCEVIETSPGWAHDITNIGEGELICLLWANEVFDPNQPDTISFPMD